MNLKWFKESWRLKREGMNFVRRNSLPVNLFNCSSRLSNSLSFFLSLLLSLTCVSRKNYEAEKILRIPPCLPFYMQECLGLFLKKEIHSRIFKIYHVWLPPYLLVPIIYIPTLTDSVFLFLYLSYIFSLAQKIQGNKICRYLSSLIYRPCLDVQDWNMHEIFSWSITWAKHINFRAWFNLAQNHLLKSIRRQSDANATI